MTQVYVVMTEDGIDQACTTRKEARKECDDLKEMGFEAKIKTFPSWAAFEAFEDKLNS